MADSFEQPPSSDLLARAKEYRNLQEEVSGLFVKQTRSIADILGLHHNIDKSLMLQKARRKELNDDIRRNKEALILAEKATAMAVSTTDKKNAKNIEDALNDELSAMKKELDVLGKINLMAMLPLIGFLNDAWNLFNSLDKSAERFRLKMGYVRDNVSEIRSTAQKLAIDFMNVGVTIDMAYDSFSALGKEMGSVRLASESLVKTTALLKAQLGIAEEDSAGFFRNMAAVSQSTMEAQENMAYTAQSLSAAAGVPFADIMRDVAKMSGQTLTMVSRVPTEIIRAAIEAKRMNTNLGDMARSGREILNFSESVNAEMEASVLLGRSINLQRARQLAYNKNLIGSNEEILRISRSINFENLDVFQQEAFARATGKSVEELLKMGQAQRQWERAKNSNDPTIMKQVVAIERMRNASNELLLNETEKTKLYVQTISNQTRLAAITQKWHQVVAQAAEAFIPFLDMVLSIAPKAIEIGVSMFKWYAITLSVAKSVEKIGLWMSKIFSGSVSMFGTFVKIQQFGIKILNLFGTVGKFFIKIGSILAEWMGPLSKIVSPFLKILGPIGWIITAFQAISGAIDGWKGSTGGFVDELTGGVLGALRSIIPGFDWIVEKLGNFGILIRSVAIGFSTAGGFIGAWIPPIAKAFGVFGKFLGPIGLIVTGVQLIYSLFTNLNKIEWVKGDWIGNIGKGLAAIGNSLYDVLISPFVKAYDWIMSFFGGHSPSQLGLNILSGITSVGTMLFDALTYPFRMASAWISDKFSFGGLADKLRGGLGSLTKTIEKNASDAYIPAITISPNETKIPGAQKDKTDVTVSGDKNDSSSSDKILQDILVAINSLNSNLASGKIGLYLDGQLLSATLARQTDFRGGYGVNKV